MGTMAENEFYMTIYSTLLFTLNFNCAKKKRDDAGWKQTYVEVASKHPFEFKRTVVYHGEKVQIGYDTKTGKKTEIMVFDFDDRNVMSSDVRMILVVYHLPFIQITNAYDTVLGGQRNRETRVYFENEALYE